MENATNMMISTFKWRDEFNTDALASEEFPQDVFGPVGRVFGKDKGGRPVTYVPPVCTSDRFRSKSSHEATTSTGVTKTSLSSLPMFLDS